MSIRKIAERIEYSPAAIYSYFASKDDIYLALAEDGFRRLDAKLRTAPQDGPPLDRVRSGWWAFYEFSKEQPAYFELMFVDRSVPQITEGWEGFEILQALMAEAATRLQRRRRMRASSRLRSTRSSRCTSSGPRSIGPAVARAVPAPRARRRPGPAGPRRPRIGHCRTEGRMPHDIQSPRCHRSPRHIRNPSMSAAHRCVLGLGDRRRAGWQVSPEATAQAPPAEATPRLSTCRSSPRRPAASKSSLEISGTLAPRSRVPVKPRLPGALERVLVDIGDAVTAGQPVATIDRREIDAQADAAIAAVVGGQGGARERRSDAGQRRARARPRAGPVREGRAAPPAPRRAETAHRAGTGPAGAGAANLAQAEAALRRAREVQRDTTITSPVAGHVVERNYDPGAMPGDEPVVVVADLRQMKLEAGVSELEAGRLRVGMKAEVEVQAKPGETFRGRAGGDRAGSQRTQPPLPHRGSRAERRQAAALGHVRDGADRHVEPDRRRARAARGRRDHPRRQARGAEGRGRHRAHRSTVTEGLNDGARPDRLAALPPATRWSPTRGAR